MILAIGILAGIALIVAACCAEEAGSTRRGTDLPAATKREIRRDRKQRIADLSRSQRKRDDELDASRKRVTSEIAKLGDHYEPPAGWQDKVRAMARRQERDDG